LTTLRPKAVSPARRAAARSRTGPAVEPLRDPVVDEVGQRQVAKPRSANSDNFSSEPSM